MRVKREVLLAACQSVAPGLATRETSQLSTCFVFLADGRLVAFNEEICASCKSPIPIVGAVKAKPLLDLLAKLPDELIEVDEHDGHLRIKGKTGRRSGLRLEQDASIPIEVVGVPEEWLPIEGDFSEAVQAVVKCASRDTDDDFCWTCVHLHPDYIEATDRTQIGRYSIQMGIEEELLVRAEVLQKIVGYGVTEISATNAWVHFRNPAGLVLSVRRFLDDYGDLTQYLDVKAAEPIVLPGSLTEVLKIIEIFSSHNAEGNFVLVDLREGRMQLEGRGAFGYAQEPVQVAYTGRPIKFRLSPGLLKQIIQRSNDCGLADGKLVINSGEFRYVVSLIVEKAKG